MAAEARPRAAPRAGPLGRRNPGGGRRAPCPVRLPHSSLARGQGATDLRLGGPDTVDWILEQTGGFGADYTFEATGIVAVMRQAVESARMGWAHVRGGEGRDARHRRGSDHRAARGRVVVRGLKSRAQVPPLIDRWMAGDLDVQPFLSHELTLDEVNRGFELMEAQDGIRSVIRFG